MLKILKRLKGENHIMKPCNDNILKALELSRELMVLADKGDMQREDSGCGVLYGVVRDAAYKIKERAEKEKQNHKLNHVWK
jgi:hypothetical protein